VLETPEAGQGQVVVFALAPMTHFSTPVRPQGWPAGT
jgi:hypothetical protein